MSVINIQSCRNICSCWLKTISKLKQLIFRQKRSINISGTKEQKQGTG